MLAFYSSAENIFLSAIRGTLRRTIPFLFLTLLGTFLVSQDAMAQRRGTNRSTASKVGYEIVTKANGEVEYIVKDGDKTVYSKIIGIVSDKPEMIRAVAEKQAQAAVGAYNSISHNYSETEMPHAIEKQMMTISMLANRGGTNVAEAVCTYSGTIDGTDPTMPDRLLRPGGTGSTCAVPQPCPGNFGGVGPYSYETLSFTNTTGASQCVTINLTWVAGPGSAVHPTAYLGSFNPLSLCTNYIADPYSSAISGIPQSFSFDLANGATAVIVLTSPNGGDVSYTMTVDGLTPDPVIILQPLPQTFCGSGTPSFSVGATGAGLVYQWELSTNGGGSYAPIGGATSATYSPGVVTTAQNGYLYRCVVTATAGCTSSVTSTPALLTVNPLPVHSGVTASPNPVCTNTTGSTTITGTVSGGTVGGGTFSSGTINLAIPDNTTVSNTIVLPVLSIPTASDLRVSINVTHTWVGDLRFQLTSPCGVTYLFDRPGLNTPTGCCGNSADLSGVYTFDLSAATVIPESGGGVVPAGNYIPSDLVGNPHNWSGNTFPCATAGNWTLAITDGAGGDVGNLADWAIMVPGGYTHSLTGPGAIVQNPPSGPNNANGSFTVSGLAPGSYSYTFTSTDGVGCSVSTIVNVQVNTIPSITVVPASAAICPGQVQQINVFGAGSGLIPFNTGGAITIPAVGTSGISNPYPSVINVSGLPVSGATVKSVTINGFSHTFPDDVDIVLVSPTGTPVILMSDVGGSADNTGQNFTFDQSAASLMSFTGFNPTGTYRPSNDGATDPFVAPGPGTLTQATPTLASFAGNMNGNWNLYVVDDVGGDIGAITSWGITFDVQAPANAVFTSQNGLYLDAAATIPYTGTNVSTVYASPTVTTTYTATSTVAGCTSAPVTTTITVNPLTTISLQPVSTGTICAGSIITFSVTAAGTAPLTYQWQVSTNGGLSWSNLANAAPYSGVTTTTLTINPVAASMTAYQYRCIVTGGCGPAVTSNAAILTVDQISHVPGSVTATPSTFCAPGPTTITGTATGGVLTGGMGVVGTSGTINLPILDNATATNTINIPAATAGTMANFNQMQIRLNVTHTWVGDIAVTLTTPCGNTIVFDRPGFPASFFGNADNLGGVYTFDVAAGTIIPETSVGGNIPPGSYQPSNSANPGVAHNWTGVTYPCNPTGNWTISIQDFVGGDQGNLVSWQILGPTLTNYTHTLTGPGTITQNPSTGPNNQTGNFSVTGLSSGVQTFNFTSTDPLGCSVTTPVSVTVNPIPTILITTTPSTTSTNTFSYTGPPVAIPDATPAGVNIPLVVSGLTGPVADLNFRLDAASSGVCDNTIGNTNASVDHTWNSDLIFRLTSPAGTTVTLIQQRGGSGNNFCTALLDDDGGFPATSTMTTAGAISGNFAPENPLSAFDGQNGNGTWTLNVSDNVGADIGSLRMYSLIIQSVDPPVICNGQILRIDAGALPGNPQTLINNTVTNIPGTGTSGNGNPYPAVINVSGFPAAGVTVRSVNITNYNHTFPDDVDLVLVSPTGTPVILMSDCGGSASATGQNFTFLDGAPALADAAFNNTGIYRCTNYGTPDNFPLPGPTSISQATPTLSTFSGNPNGDWKLYAVDDAGLNTGLIGSWNISFNVPGPVVFTQTAPPSPPNANSMWLDAAATIQYTGTLVNTIWVRPSVTTTYTVNGSLLGCNGSNSITVNVNQLPAITAHPTPASQTVCPGFTVTYTVGATGTGITYQWRRNGVNLVNGGFVNGVTTPTLVLSFVSAATSGTYDCVVSGVCAPPAISNGAVLTVATAPTITTQPANVTVCSGQNASFSVVAAGTPAPNIYQWQLSTDGGVTWNNILTGSAFTPTLSLTNVTVAMNGNRYRCIITNFCGQNITTNSATLTVNATPVVVATDMFNRRICLSDTLVGLTGSPVGGSWTGIGVSGFNFVPTATAVGTYVLTYTYTAANGCTNTDTTAVKVIDCPERIRLLSNDGVILYPNPNDGRFSIRINSTLYNYLGMKVYDMTGRLVNGKVVKNGIDQALVSPVFTGLVYGRVVPIDISYLPSGTYLVKFYYDDGARSSEKGFLVVIQK